jgi:DNA polymerase-4
MDLDTFFVSVERLKDSRLVGKPVIVGGTGARGVVASCSYEARLMGVHSAMPIRIARNLCPDAVVVRGDYEHYSYYSNMITGLIEENVPLYEKSSVDEFYIDMTGMDKFFGTYKYIKELREKIIKETGLPISFGLSENKTVSKVATGEAKPNNYMKIEYGIEKEFLAPLTVKKIPMVGDVTSQLLKKMGIVRIKTVQEMPQQVMHNILGENGKTIWRKANGIDTTPVEPYSERKSISSEETFDSDTIDIKKIKTILSAMTEKLAFQLRKENKLTSTITVKIRYSDFDTHTKQLRIPYTSTDHTLIKVVKEMFDKLYERRVLIRLIGVKFSGLVNGGYQINLLEDSVELIQLYQEMDYVRKRYGDKAVQRVSAVEYEFKAVDPGRGRK